MPKYIRILGVCLICVYISSCQQWSSAHNKQQANTNDLPLHIVDIRTDVTNTRQINQIIFEFNQNVAIAGDVPTNDQLSAIEMSHNLAKLCHWRFATLNALTCELTESLAHFTHYHVNITSEFRALNKSLNKDKNTSFEILTAFPANQLSPNIFETEHFFPTRFSIYKGQADADFIDHIANNLVLKSPSGNYLSKWLTVRQTNSSAGHLALEITLPDTLSIKHSENRLENGRYQIVLPAGFRPKTADGWQYRRLNKEWVLSEFTYHNDFVFYGLECTLNEAQGLDTFSQRLRSNATSFDCRPESIAMGFSRPLARNTDNSNIHTDNWISGPRFEIQEVNANASKNIFTYRLKLQGESEYSFDLSKLRSSNNQPLKSPNTLALITQPSTPLWYLKDPDFVTVDASAVEDSLASRMPIVVRRNAADMQQSMLNIDSPQALLNYINNKAKQSLPENTRPFPGTAKTKSWEAEQDIAFADMLKRPSGLVAITLKGTKHNQYNLRSAPDKALESEKAELMVNAAAFNLLVWQSEELLVQAIDWDANRLANVEMFAICEGFTEIFPLGNTNNDGILHIKQASWLLEASSGSREQCWLWAQRYAKSTSSDLTTLQSAAIKLSTIWPYRYLQTTSSSNLTLNHVEAYTWTTQPLHKPGDLVNIGFFGREQGPNGLQPISEFNDFKFTLIDENGDTFTTVDFDPLSPMGFARAQFTLSSDTRVGTYFVTMSQADFSPKTVGYIVVEEFIAPEFEQVLTAPEVAYKHDEIELEIRASRLNGAPLIDAKVKVHQEYRPRYNSLEDWPQNFDFSSWLEYTIFDENRHEDNFQALSLEQKETVDKNRRPETLALNDKGYLRYVSPPLTATFPIAQYDITSEVTADDGETQASTRSILYLSREHYIGTRVTSAQANNLKRGENSQLQLIAVSKKGKPIKELAVKVAFYDRQPDAKDRTLLGICEVSYLPNTCTLPEFEGELVADITSGKQEYLSYRSTWQSRDPKIDIQPIFKIDSEVKTANSGDTVVLNLTSQYAGKATLSLWSGTLKKVWLQFVNKGENSISFTTENSWQPSMTIRVALPLTRVQTQAHIDDLLDATNNSMQREYTNNNLNQLRILNDDIQILLTPSLSKPEIKLNVSKNSALPSSEIEISVSADQHVETHLWLVNAALWNTSFMQVAENDFDYSTSLFSQQAFQDNIRYQALNQSLLMPSLLDQLRQRDQENMLYSPRSRSGGIEMDSMAATGSKLNASGLNVNAADFVQSKWLGQLTLSANRAQSIAIKLPQLIGRWKIVALSANQYQTQVTSKDITTASDVEYFVDAPAAIIQSDQANMAITLHNRSNQVITDTLTLWINDKQQQEINVNLAANSYTRHQLPLPALSLGQNIMNITSRHLPDFATQHKVLVLPAHINKTSTWLVDDIAKTHNIAMPPSLLKDSLSLSVIPSGQSLPNWSALGTYNKDYSHQYWEQALSRAVSLSYNPQATKIWPQANESLQKEINRLHKLSYENGLYSYFAQGPGDKFLTAYTYLVHSWLAGKAINIPLAMENKTPSIKLTAYAMLDDKSTDQLAKSMALYALASNSDIDLAEAISLRQQIGTVIDHQAQQASLLQALALKQLGAEPALYQDTLDSFAKQGYLDSNTSLFNESSYQCFAAMLYAPKSAEYAALTKEAVDAQLPLGHFGSTIANAVCSKLFSAAPANEQNESISLPYTQVDAMLTYQYAPNPHWATLQYKQKLETVEATANGLHIQRTLWRKHNDEWLLITDATRVNIGDLVKVEIKLQSPKTRQHVAISDATAGALEAIYPNQNTFLYLQEHSETWFDDGNIAIKDGKVTWYKPNLAEGETTFTYFGRVRHNGVFSLPPATAEAMYREDVNAQTAAGTLRVGSH